MKKDSRVIQVNDISIGENIKKFRMEKGLKQTEVIARLQLLGIEISVYSYSKIENGKQNPTVSLLRALTEIFQCDYNVFF
jgi:transcriptional regulator with XRE-family HTH domain